MWIRQNSIGEVPAYNKNSMANAIISILRSYPRGKQFLLGKQWAEASTVPLGP